MSQHEYQVISLTVSPEDTDWVQGELYAQGCLGLIEEEGAAGQVILKAYFEIDEKIGERLKYFNSNLPSACKAAEIKLNASDFKPAPFEPIQLAGDFWIVPPEDMLVDAEKSGDQLARPGFAESRSKLEGACVVIRPGMAFGTGRHETTQLCAEAMLKMDPVPGSLLDVGTGSGVLAILARKLGVEKVVAVEISEDARANARENFTLNQIEDIELCGNINDVSEQFEVVIANILTPTILQLREQLLARMNPASRLILSGIAGKKEAEQIEANFSDLNLQVRVEKAEWHCFVYRL